MRTAQIRVPNNPTTWDDPVSTGSGDLGLTSTGVTTTWMSGPTVIAKNFLGLNVTLNLGQQASIITNLLSQVTSNLLNPMLTTVNNNLLHPLYDILGLTVGGADVFGQRPFCSEPSLVG